VGDFHGLLVFFIFTGALAKRQYDCSTQQSSTRKIILGIG